MAEVKVTQKELFGQVIAIVEGADVDASVKAELVAFLNKKVDQIDAKAAKAKEKAAEAKVKGDELRDIVASLLTDEIQTIDAILAQVDFADVTKAKVTARLTQLVKAGVAVKESVKVDTRTLTAYKLA
jgi:hypothetical protein